MTRVEELEAALRKCANLTRNQQWDSKTVRWVGEEVGRIVDAVLVKVNACQVSLKTPADEAAFADVVAAAVRHMRRRCDCDHCPACGRRGADLERFARFTLRMLETMTTQQFATGRDRTIRVRARELLDLPIVGLEGIAIAPRRNRGQPR